MEKGGRTLSDSRRAPVRPRPTSTASSMSSKDTWMTSRDTHRMGKGTLLYTGPEGKSQHKVHVELEHRLVGIGTHSSEQTTELTYLCRAPDGVKFPEQMAKKPGSIGWAIPPKGDPRAWPVHMQLRSEEELMESVENDKIIFNRR